MLTVYVKIIVETSYCYAPVQMKCKLSNNFSNPFLSTRCTSIRSYKCYTMKIGCVQGNGIWMQSDFLIPYVYIIVGT